MKKVMSANVVCLGLPGCLGTTGVMAGGGGGALPITVNGKILASAMPATVSVTNNPGNNLAQHSAQLTSAKAADKSTAGGMAFSMSGTTDPAPVTNQGYVATLISASSSRTLAGGTAVNGFADAKGNVYFENGNPGDLQDNATNGSVSGVGVYNPPVGSQIVLSDVTTIRHREGTDGAGSAIFGAGFVGNATATMPTGQSITYRAFLEGSQSAYDDGTGAKQLVLSGTPSLMADLTTGKVSGGVNGARLETLSGGVTSNLNPAIDRMVVDGTITGNSYAGTALLVDAGGTVTGTQNSEMIGGFFGANATDTALAVQSSGTMMLGGASSNYFLQGVMGGTR